MLPLVAAAFGALCVLEADRNSRRPQRFGRAPEPHWRPVYGAVPPPPAAAASGQSVLQSAALAAPGSWTRRNVLQQGAQSAYARRLAGTATEADFAVLGAARPGIASGVSGPISGAWSGNPWQPGPGVPPGPRSGLFSATADEFDEDTADAIGDAVLEEMGL